MGTNHRADFPLIAILMCFLAPESALFCESESVVAERSFVSQINPQQKPTAVTTNPHISLDNRQVTFEGLNLRPVLAKPDD